MKKKLLKTASWVMCAVLLTGIAAPRGEVSQAAGIKLNKTKAVLSVGQFVKLKVKNYKKKVKWSSSKKKVAEVSKKGVVRAKSAGKAVITAKAGKKAMKCKVTVKKDKKPDVVQPTAYTTVTPSGQLSDAVPTVPPVITDAPVPTDAAVPTDATVPTEQPVEPSPTPEYMQEGAFVYDKLDISWIDPDKPMVAFTFDDGPVGSSDTSYSMRIQKALKEYNFHATFNYVTSKLGSDNMNNEILMAMEAGHEIANHTSQWSSLSSFADGDAVAAEIEKARKTLSDLTGISDFTLRPPNLAVNNTVQNNCNVPLIGSSIISNDWEDSVTKEHVVEVTKKAKDGDIVLLHETMQHTAEAVEELVPYFAEQGYQIVSVVELFAAKNIPLFPGNYYNKAQYQAPRS